MSTQICVNDWIRLGMREDYAQQLCTGSVELKACFKAARKAGINVNDAMAGCLAETEASSVDRFKARTYSTGAGDTGISIKEMALLALLVKLTQSPQGLKVLETWGKELIKTVGDMMHALGQASAANKVSSWANPYLCALVLDRFGLVNPAYLLEFKLGLSLISGASVAEGFVDNIQGIMPFSASEPSEFPSSIVYSARGEGGTIKEEITAKGLSTSDLEQLRSLLKKEK